MNKKTVLSVLILFVIVVSVVINVTQSEDSSSPDAADLSFTPYTNTEQVSVKLATTTLGDAIFTGIGYVELPLVTSITDSGTHYIHEALGLEVSITEQELSVYQNTDLIFTGTLGSVGRAVPESEPVTTPLSDPVSLLLATSWQWQAGGSDSRIPEDNPFTLFYQADGTVIGGTDCNGFTAQYELNGKTNAIQHTMIMSTKMACEGSTESAYLEQLEAVTSFRLTPNLHLILTTESGTELYFVPQRIPML